MKWLTILAMTVALVGPAAADWKPKPPTTFLPVEMQGNWCLDWDNNKWDTFHRSGLRSELGANVPECPSRRLWVVWSNGRTAKGGQVDSTFYEIDKLDRYVYQVRGKCRCRCPSTLPSYPNVGVWRPTPTSIHTETLELHFVDGALVAWGVPDV